MCMYLYVCVYVPVQINDDLELIINYFQKFDSMFSQRIVQKSFLFVCANLLG